MEQFDDISQNMNLTSTMIFDRNQYDRLSIMNHNDQFNRIQLTPPHLQISTPKTPPTVIRRRSSTSSMSSTTSCSSYISEINDSKLQPLSTYRLKPITQKVRSMVMTLTESGQVILEFIKVKNGVERIIETFSVSQDGQEIILRSACQSSQDITYDTSNKRTKTFSVTNLPERYHKKYEHARKFVTLVQSKTPKVTLYNQQAKCMLMENFPNPNFEVHFYSGRKIISNWSGMKLVDEKQGSILSLSTPRIQQQFSNEIQQLIRFSDECQQQCLQFETLIKSTASSSSCSSDRNGLFPVTIGNRPVRRDIVTPPMPEDHPVNVSAITSSSCSSCPSDTGSSVIRQIRVPNIGQASQLDNGDIWVEFEDGTHLGIKPTVTTVTYINQIGLVKKFRKSEPLPENVKVKLASVPIVLQHLMNLQKCETMPQQHH